MSEDHRDAGYDDWFDALEDGEPYALRCPLDHHSLPPRGSCPDCGSAELEPESIPETGTVRTYSLTRVPTPAFAEDAPYVIAIADFEMVSVTGQLRGIEPDEVRTGLPVTIEGERSETDRRRLVVFRPVD